MPVLAKQVSYSVGLEDFIREALRNCR